MNATVGVLASLVLLATFVSHDVLMAIDGHATLSPVAVQQAADGHRGPHRAPDAGTSGCAVTQPATMPQAAIGIDLCWTIVPVPWPSFERTTGRSYHSLIVPGHPPSMRRALLQVYRN